MAETHIVPQVGFEDREWPRVCAATGKPAEDTMGDLGWMSRFHIIVVGLSALGIGVVPALLVANRWPTGQLPITARRRRLVELLLVLAVVTSVIGLIAIAFLWLNLIGGPSEEQIIGMRGQFWMAWAAVLGGAFLDVVIRQALWVGGWKKGAYIRLSRLHPDFVAALGVKGTPSPADDERGN